MAQRLARAKGDPSPPAMLLGVVQHVAPLAERLQVPRPVVRRIVVEMRGREHDTGGPGARAGRGGRRLPTHSAASAVAPGLRLGIPPCAVTQMADDLAVWPPAAFAPAARPLEADHGRELRPVDRIEPAMLRPDRDRSGFPCSAARVLVAICRIEESIT